MRLALATALVFASACGQLPGGADSSEESPQGPVAPVRNNHDAEDPEAQQQPVQTAPPEAKPGPQRAPVVLMHGMAGFRSLGPWEYFYGVADALKKDGVEVFVTQVDPIQKVEVRAKQAADQIAEFMAKSGARKVHLVGHSQGGLDARYLVSKLGFADRVATVTTIGTPHRGTRIADVALGLFPGDSKAAAAALANVVVSTTTSTDADIEQQLVNLSVKNAEKFNADVPDAPGIPYYSTTGLTQPWLLVDQKKTDVVDPLLLNAYWISYALDGDNDGLVPVKSGKWGEYWGEIPADHLDEMGWVPDTPQPAFNHLLFYRRLAQFLLGLGPKPL